MAKTWLVVTLVLLGGAAACARAADAPAPADWPQFRGPGGLGASAAPGLPLEWSPDRNLVWKVDLPGAGASSPIALGDRIYITCYSGYGVPDKPGDMAALRRHVVCLAAADGKVLWKADVPARLAEQPTTREDHGYASSTPAADADCVYVFFGKSGVFAFDQDGREVWRADVGSGLSGWGSAASPVLCGDLLVVNASVESESLVALDKRTGKEAWRAGGIKEAWNTPLLVPVEGGKTELVLAIHGKILAFAPATGDALWSCDTDIGWYMAPSLVAHAGVVYCIGGRSGGSLAVRAGGRGDVTASRRLWKGRKGSNVSSPVYHEGRLYFADDATGTVSCLDARTGEAVYEAHLAPEPGQIYASALLADGRLYYVARQGGAFVVAAGPQFRQLAYNRLDDRAVFDASPVVAGGRLLLRSTRALYCLGEKEKSE